jgi:WD40 repeat protein
MRILQGHKCAVLALTFSPDGRWLASRDKEGGLRLWEPAEGYRDRCLCPSRPDYRWGNERLAFSGDGRTLASRGCEGLQLWDSEAGLLRATLRQAERGLFPDLALAGDRLVANRGWSLDEGDVLRQWDVSSAQEGPPLRVLQGHETLLCLAFEPSGKRLACGNGLILDAQSGSEKLRLPFSAGSLLAWSAGRALLASRDANRANCVHVFDPDSGKKVATVSLPSKHVQDLAFTPDGRLLLTVSNEQTAKLWDTETWQERDTLAWGVGKLKSVAVAPDGMCAAAGGERGKIVVWDLD